MDFLKKSCIRDLFTVEVSKRGKQILCNKEFRFYSLLINKRVSEPYLVWRCTKTKETYCKAIFYTDTELLYYSGLSNSHKCNTQRSHNVSNDNSENNQGFDQIQDKEDTNFCIKPSQNMLSKRAFCNQNQIGGAQFEINVENKVAKRQKIVNKQQVYSVSEEINVDSNIADNKMLDINDENAIDNVIENYQPNTYTQEQQSNNVWAHRQELYRNEMPNDNNNVVNEQQTDPRYFQSLCTLQSMYDKHDGFLMKQSALQLLCRKCCSRNRYNKQLESYFNEMNFNQITEIDCSASVIVTTLKLLGRKYFNAFEVYEQFKDVFGYTIDVAFILQEMGVYDFTLCSIGFNLSMEFAQKFQYYFQLPRHKSTLNLRLGLLKDAGKVVQGQTTLEQIQEFVNAEQGFAIVLCNLDADNDQDRYAGHYLIVFAISDGCVTYIDPSQKGIQHMTIQAFEKARTSNGTDQSIIFINYNHKCEQSKNVSIDALLDNGLSINTINALQQKQQIQAVARDKLNEEIESEKQKAISDELIYLAQFVSTNFIRLNKKSSLPLEMILKGLDQTGKQLGRFKTKDSLKHGLQQIAELVPNWIQIINIEGKSHIKCLDKKLQAAVITQHIRGCNYITQNIKQNVGNTNLEICSSKFDQLMQTMLGKTNYSVENVISCRSNGTLDEYLKLRFDLEQKYEVTFDGLADKYKYILISSVYTPHTKIFANNIFVVALQQSFEATIDIKYCASITKHTQMLNIFIQDFGEILIHMGLQLAQIGKKTACQDFVSIFNEIAVLTKQQQRTENLFPVVFGDCTREIRDQPAPTQIKIEQIHGKQIQDKIDQMDKQIAALTGKLVKREQSVFSRKLQQLKAQAEMQKTLAKNLLSDVSSEKNSVSSIPSSQLVNYVRDTFFDIEEDGYETHEDIDVAKYKQQIKEGKQWIRTKEFWDNKLLELKGDRARKEEIIESKGKQIVKLEKQLAKFQNIMHQQSEKIQQQQTEVQHLKDSITQQAVILKQDYTVQTELTHIKIEQELVKLGYQCVSIVGEGGFGIVFKCTKDEKECAVKVPLKQSCDKEIKVIKDLHSKNFLNQQFVVAIDDTIRVCQRDALVMKYFKQTLVDFIKQPHTIEQTKALFYFILRGISTAHTYKDGITHRDLKPHNIFLNEFMCPLVADWGMASRDNKEHTGGTFIYMDPRIFDTQKPVTTTTMQKLSGTNLKKRLIDYKAADIWSLGIVLYQMLHQKVPFTKEQLVAFRDYPWDKDICRDLNIEDKDARIIICSMLNLNPSKRPSVGQLIQDQWFKSLEGQISFFADPIDLRKFFNSSRPMVHSKYEVPQKNIDVQPLGNEFQAQFSSQIVSSSNYVSTLFNYSDLWRIEDYQKRQILASMTEDAMVEHFEKAKMYRMTIEDIRVKFTPKGSSSPSVVQVIQHLQSLNLTKVMFEKGQPIDPKMQYVRLVQQQKLQTILLASNFIPEGHDVIQKVPDAIENSISMQQEEEKVNVNFEQQEHHDIQMKCDSLIEHITNISTVNQQKPTKQVRFENQLKDDAFTNLEHGQIESNNQQQPVLNESVGQHLLIEGEGIAGSIVDTSKVSENQLNESNAQKRKRTKKEDEKNSLNDKANKRVNRDEDMEFFARYYKERFNMNGFIQFKKAKNHPQRIYDMIQDTNKAQKIQRFIRNQKYYKND